MEDYNCEFSRDELGEVIEMVRLKLGLSIDAFASAIGTKTKYVVNAEEGNDMSCYMVIEKMMLCKKVKDIFNIKIEFSM